MKTVKSCKWLDDNGYWKTVSLSNKLTTKVGRYGPCIEIWEDSNKELYIIKDIVYENPRPAWLHITDSNLFFIELRELEMQLNTMFIWEETPQGKEYWKDVKKQLNVLINELKEYIKEVKK